VTDRRSFIGLLAGGLLAAPFAAEAQQAGKSYRVCFLALSPGEDTTSMKPLLERLRELGYDEGKNMTFEYRSAEGRSERLPQLAMELVRGRPDVLIAGFGTLTAQAAKAATLTVPIVFTSVGDPVGAGLVASLGRPGGNVTGLSGLTEVGGKHLQLLRELSPVKEVIAVLVNPETPFARLALQGDQDRREGQPYPSRDPRSENRRAGAPRAPGGSRPPRVACSCSGIR
jgi:putative ABC transport system substrate-binding protein